MPRRPGRRLQGGDSDGCPCDTEGSGTSHSVSAAQRAGHKHPRVGVVAGLLHVAADLLAGLLFPAYSFRDLTTSELGAIGSPTETLFNTLVTIQLVIVGAFGIGVLRFGKDDKVLRWVGILLIAVSVVGVASAFTPINIRGAEQGLTGTLHVVLIGTDAFLLMVAIVGCGAQRTIQDPCPRLARHHVWL